MRKITVIFLAVTFIPLTCAGAFAEMSLGDFSLGGYIALGGGFLADGQHRNRGGYLEEYVPFPRGVLAETDLSLRSKDALQYYRFWMSYPGLRSQDFLLQMGKLGVYHAEVEYDQLQHVYCTVNPHNDHMQILVQRLRFSGYYSPTPNIDLFAENTFLRRTGQQPTTLNGGPPNAYNFTAFLRPIDYSQNDMRAGFAFERPAYQFRVAYHLSTFDDANTSVRVPFRTGPQFESLPPSNIAHYVTAEGALNLLAYKTRITSSFSYGWLSQNDDVFQSPRTGGNFLIGNAGLSASTIAGDISGVTRPWAPLTLRYSYRVYDFENNDLTNQMLLRAFSNERPLLNMEHYSYLRQTATIGADYKVNSMMAFDLAYAYQRVTRTDDQGTTNNHSPQVGIRLFPTAWLTLIANYAYSTRQGSNFLVADPLTFKTYAGDLTRNKVNFIAELLPANNVTVSTNFSLYNDDFRNSFFGLQSDQGWSAGADVCWRPFDRVALSLGYDHQQISSKVRATQEAGEGIVTGDAGPILRTTDLYDAFTARVDFKLIPNKLRLTTTASYSFSSSHFHNQLIPNLHEDFADVSTYLTYVFNEHWACKLGYIFEMLNMTNSYQKLYLTKTSATAFQQLNTLDGFYKNGTAHVLQAFLQYKF